MNRLGIYHCGSETNNVEQKYYYVDGFHVLEVSSCSHKLVMTMFQGEFLLAEWLKIYEIFLF